MDAPTRYLSIKRPHLQFTYFLLFITFFLSYASVLGQTVYPVKQSGQWGLIDARGKLLTRTTYELIGNPDQYGYLVVQQGDLLGLLGEAGKIVLPVRFADIQVLDAGIIAVLEKGEWRIIDPLGNTLLQSNYQQLRPLGDGLLAYRGPQGWGVISASGEHLVEPVFTDVKLLNFSCFQTRMGSKIGLINRKGQTILEAIADEVVLDTMGFVLYQEGGHWGAVSMAGKRLFSANYLTYAHLGTDYLLLTHNSDKQSVFSHRCSRVFQVPEGAEVVPFSENYLGLRYRGEMGLLNRCGDQVLTGVYQEIQPFSSAIFRTKTKDGWGLTAGGDQMVLAGPYEYISPLDGRAAVLKNAGRYGLVNYRGEELQPPVYDLVELTNNSVSAFTGKGNGASLTKFLVDAQGRLQESGSSNEHFQIRIGGASVEQPTELQKYLEQSNRLLDKYEWFYTAEDGRWGMRNRLDGSIALAPTFTQVEALPEFGFSLVGLSKSSEFTLERTTFRTTTSYGLLLNDAASLVTELILIDLRVEDWRAGSQVARCMFEDGRFGLIDRQGRIVRRDLVFMGPFQDGLASVTFEGKLTGTLEDDPRAITSLTSFMQGIKAKVSLSDYTTYDQEFARNANLVCKGCKFGYLNEAGTVTIQPLFTTMAPFRNGKAIVEMSNGTGIIDHNGLFTVPPAYDQIEALRAEGKTTYRLSVSTKQQGLVDTMGNFRLYPEFEDVGKISKELIAIKSGNSWGFVGQNGALVIPCQFDEVLPFSEGFAAVRKGLTWTHIDATGRVRSKEAYRDLGDFENGLAFASSKQRFGYIDTSGNYVIQPIFDRAFSFEQGVARVIVNGEHGLIDLVGNWVLRPKYANISAFQENGTAIVRLTGTQPRFSIIDRTGRQLTTKTYRQIDPFSQDRALVRTESAYGYIDGRGREVIDPVWTQAESFQQGRAVVRQNGKCGFIDLNGSLVIPCKYSRCLAFDGDRAVVYQGTNQAGLIDRSGTEIIAPSLNRMLHFREGRGLMRDNRQGFYFITDKAALYDGYYDEARPFYHGVAAIRRGNNWGLINHKGLPLILPKFSFIEPFVNGLARVTLAARYGLVSQEGYQILPAEYSYIEAVTDDLIRVEKGNEVGYISATGKWIWPLAK